MATSVMLLTTSSTVSFISSKLMSVQLKILISDFRGVLLVEVGHKKIYSDDYL